MDDGKSLEAEGDSFMLFKMAGFHANFAGSIAGCQSIFFIQKKYAMLYVVPLGNPPKRGRTIESTEDFKLSMTTIEAFNGRAVRNPFSRKQNIATNPAHEVSSSFIKYFTAIVRKALILSETGPSKIF